MEIKHGRASISATMGYNTPEYFKLAGSISLSWGIMFRDIPNGLAAASKGPGLGWMQLIFVAIAIEGNVVCSVASRTTPRLAWAPWMHTATTGPRGRSAARRPTW